MKYKLWRLTGIVILIFILSRLDWAQFKQTIKRADLVYLFFAFILNIPQLWFKATRWQLLLRTQGKEIRNLQAFFYYLSATFLGVITPGRLGEFAKTVYLKQDKVASISYGFSSVVVDRLWDLFLLVFLGLSGLIAIHPFRSSEIIGGVGLTGFLFLACLLAFSKGTEKIVSLLYKKLLRANLPEIAKEGFEQFKEGIQHLRGKRILPSLILTTIAYAVFFLQCYLIAVSFHVSLTYFSVIPIMALVNLFSFIPISVSGLGTRDAALLFLLGQRGVAYASIMAFSMGILFVFYVGGGVFGLVAWLIKPVTLGKGAPEG